MIDYAKAIPKFFDIDDKEGRRVPFELNAVQMKYLNMMRTDYPNLQGIRENALKARQQGFSTLIMGMFGVDFITRENVGAQIISHKEKDTKILMNRMSKMFDYFCDKNRINRKEFLVKDSDSYLESYNGSYIYIGTAGAKTVGRGGTLLNLHWSEVAFYPSGEILDAEKLIAGAEQQVPMGSGKIFRESTGNVIGDFFETEWQRGFQSGSSFKSRFFPWFDYPQYALSDDQIQGYNPSTEDREMIEKYNITLNQIAWYRRKQAEFKTNALFLREYPTTPEEAFLATGSGFFDADALKWYIENKKEPIQVGYLAQDGGWM